MERDEFMGLVRSRVGDDTSDEALAFVEKMATAYDEMAVKNDGEDWEKKYHENDEMWRAKFRDRFFNSPADQRAPQEKTADTITIKDLFQ